MKLFPLTIIILIVCGCQKQTPSNVGTESGVTTSADATLLPLKYHATSFTTAYPVVKGQVPPFMFTKTLYTDTRVKTLHMVSRTSASTKYSTNQYYIYDYTFSYALNSARAKGTRKLFAKSGTLVKTFYDDLSFTFNSAGICTRITAVGHSAPLYLQTYSTAAEVAFSTETYGFSIFKDAKGNFKKSEGAWLSGLAPSVTFTYDLTTTPKGILFYVPTQYAIDEWYSLLETMQWAPAKSYNPRKSVSLYLSFLLGDQSTGSEQDIIIQGQKYLNHKYDVNGNLISYTYGDGVPQKITWK